MKKYIGVLLIQFLSFAVLAAVPSKINAPFFKVEKNGQVAYMLGTIHTGLDYSALPQNIQDTAANAATLIVETDITQGQMTIAQAFPPGAKDSLKNQLTTEEWAKFSAVVGPVLGPQAGALMDRLHPVVAISAFSSANFPATKEPIDRHLVSLYTQAQKPIQFFEDISVQINVLEATQTIDTLKMQLQITPEQMAQQSNLLLYIYASGSMQMIEQFLVNPMPQDQLVLLLDNRNLAWQQKFESLFNQPGEEFFAFGAAHLPGELGMVKLVQDLGFTVTQIHN